MLNVQSVGLWAISATVALVQLAPGSAIAKSAPQINRVAQAITVKIETNGSLGSGVLIRKQGELYTVLTAAHVVKTGSYTITTPDNKKHPVSGSVQFFGNEVDLALIKFRSSNSYSLAKIADSQQIEGGMDLYVGGFPAPTPVITKSVFMFRTGKVVANSQDVFSGGYALVYDTNTLPGMSGGPVLNSDGELVAIHGKGDRDGRTKTDFNVGIPTRRFGSLAKSLGIDLNSPSSPRSNPQSIALVNSATKKAEQKDYPGALADVNRAIALDPNNASAYSRRGAIRLALNATDYQAALADYNKAIALDPNFAPAYINRANLKQHRFKDYVGALADSSRAIELDPKLYKAYATRANVKENIQDYAGALADFDRAIEIDNKAASLYGMRGRLKSYRFKDYAGALTDLNRAIQLDPKDAFAHKQRALVRNNLGDSAGYIADLKMAIQLYRQQGADPSEYSGLERLLKIRRAN
jgi:tetratricopeptide (TPR) repeat protein